MLADLCIVTWRGEHMRISEVTIEKFRSIKKATFRMSDIQLLLVRIMRVKRLY